MATKEDILEQLVEEYLLHEGYFVQHNVKFLPRRDHPEFVSQNDSNHSDIDVIGYHPIRSGVGKVLAVTCKSWQDGFNPANILRAIKQGKRVGGREAWKSFRELLKPKWSDAFLGAVQASTGTRKFTYVLAVSRVVGGDKRVWEECQQFIDALEGNPIKILEFSEMLRNIVPKLTTTLAGTEVGRMLQLFKAAGMEFKSKGDRSI